MNRLQISLLQKKVKTFLFSKMNKEFLTFLFFLVLSSAFWFLQTLNEDYETEFSIPLRLKNVPDNIVITTELPEHLRITVKDKGTTLMKYMFGQSFRPVQVDFATQKNVDGRVTLRQSDIQKAVLGQLASSSRLVSVKPDTLEYYYNRGQSKRVPVRLNGRLDSAPQCYISMMYFSPDSVTVYAAPNILDTLYAAYTMPVDYQDVSDTLIFSTPLKKIRGAKFVPPSVTGTLFVDIYTEKTVEVPVVGTNFPATKRLRTFPSKVNVTFQVGMSQFKRINASDFVLSVSYDELLKNTTKKVHLRLKTVPQGASHVRISPTNVDYLIEQISENEE